MKNAFDSIKNLYGEKGFKRIQESKFLIVGVGGIGSWICEDLVRTGALHLTLVDMDDICVTNINRQVHSLSDNIGKLKIDEMKKRLLQINPECEVICVHDFFSEKTHQKILAPGFDYVFDAIDSHKSKCILISQCKEREIPIIISGGAGGKFDPTKIEVRDLSKTINDQLLHWLRKTLRKHYGFPPFKGKPFRIPAVFSTELPLTNPNTDKEVTDRPKIDNSDFVNCNTGYGSAGFVTASFAHAAVSYALNQLCFPPESSCQNS